MSNPVARRRAAGVDPPLTSKMDFLIHFLAMADFQNNDIVLVELKDDAVVSDAQFPVTI